MTTKAATRITWAHIYTTEPGYELARLPDGWHTWSGSLCEFRGGQTGRHLIVRSDEHAVPPAGWREYDASDEPVQLDREESRDRA